MNLRDFLITIAIIFLIVTWIFHGTNTIIMIISSLAIFPLVKAIVRNDFNQKSSKDYNRQKENKKIYY